VRVRGGDAMRFFGFTILVLFVLLMLCWCTSP
jgi:hypothetical protein